MEPDLQYRCILAHRLYIFLESHKENIVFPRPFDPLPLTKFYFMIKNFILWKQKMRGHKFLFFRPFFHSCSQIGKKKNKKIPGSPAFKKVCHVL